MAIKKPGLLVKGIPIKARWKLLIMGIFLSLLALNIILPQYIDLFNYPGREVVSIGLIIGAVLISIGSYATETIIIALTVFVFISAFYDMGVKDFSSLRRKIVILAPIILFVELTFGKVGWIHLVKILKNQFGVSGQ